MENARDQRLPDDGTGGTMKQESPEDRELLIMGNSMVDSLERKAAEIEMLQFLYPLKESDTDDVALTVPPDAVRFGWVELEQIEAGPQNNILMMMPFLYRNTEKVCSLRIFQRKLGNYHVHSVIGKYSCKLNIYPIFPNEVRLFNEINTEHCDGKFKYVFTRNDKVLNLGDALNYFQFRMECQRLLTSYIPGSIPKKCGLLQLHAPMIPMAFVVVNGVVYIPTFYFQDLTQEVMDKKLMIRGWDLAYLKFACTCQGITAEQIAGDELIAVPMEEIKRSQVENPVVKYFWPPYEETSALLDRFV